MPLWGNVDNTANSVISATMQVNKGVSTANRDELFGNTTADVYFTGATVGQFGVNETEVAATDGVPHTGWVLRTEGSGGRAGRVFHEVLVAGSITGDAADDATFPDYLIVVNTQPADSSETTGSATSFTIDAVTQPTGGTLTYSWQVDGGPGSQTFADVADAGVYSGNTTDTLTISDNTSLDGNVYRVIVSVTGGASVTSANASLTEV